MDTLTAQTQYGIARWKIDRYTFAYADAKIVEETPKEITVILLERAHVTHMIDSERGCTEPSLEKKYPIGTVVKVAGPLSTLHSEYRCFERCIFVERRHDVPKTISDLTSGLQRSDADTLASVLNTIEDDATRHRLSLVASRLQKVLA